MQVCHYQIYFGNLERYLPKKAVYMVLYVSEYGCILLVYEKIKARLSAENICISDTAVRPRKDRTADMIATEIEVTKRTIKRTLAGLQKRKNRMYRI